MNNEQLDHKEGSTETVNPTEHAAVRYIQRFEGNITIDRALKRLVRIFRDARFVRTAPGNARLYSTHGIVFVVKRRQILTVYGVNTNGTSGDGYALQA